MLRVIYRRASGPLCFARMNSSMANEGLEAFVYPENTQSILSIHTVWSEPSPYKQFWLLCSYKALLENKSKKGLPLETQNTQNHENWRLGLIESLHMQRCSLRGCIRPLVPA